MSSRATTSTSTHQSRRHRSRSQQSRCVEVEKPKKKKGSSSLVSIPAVIKLSMLNSGLLSFDKVKLSVKDENNPLSQTIPDAPTELKFFIKLCEQRRKFPVLYKIEFTTTVETHACRHATKKNNLEKNQNQKTIPYDFNRVVLQKIPGVSDSDYINASYVDSLLKPNAYIVSQGPTEETVFDFWRMVWQENISCIVMLTKTFDFTKVMCVQYWPASKEKDECYGELPEYQIYIGVVKEEELANFHIRTFRLYKMHNNVKAEERILLQFHYTAWSSHSCPFANAILEFRRRVRSVVGNTLKSDRPMLVHCNDGGGRSGVFMAIDANIELAEEEDSFYVFGYLKKLRQSRKGLIENVDQYKFVYDTLEEYIVCGNSFFPVKDLSLKLKQKSVKDPATKLNEYQREYAQICKQTPRFSIGDCAGGHRADNREKNRDVLCVPPDNFRPYLTSFQGNAFTDYINAVFVDGYTKPREYIVTEWPLKSTCGEFWSLVYDHECSAVVVLCQPPHTSQNYPPFWPEGRHSKKYGPVFTIDHISHNHYSNIKTWIFRINKKVISLTELMAGVKAVPRTVQLFQLTCWPLSHKVPTSTNSLVELMNMVERWRQKAMGPVCVVSPDGRSRAGVYCAANACIEQVIQHSEVDVFQAVKTVRRHRPQLVDNMTEYKYCYDLVLHYVLHYLNKENEKKFIDFGRGVPVPLTPNTENLEQIKVKSNTGRIIIDKTITDFELKSNILSSINEPMAESGIGGGGGGGGSRYVIDKDGKIVERKKKCRLYSLGGYEPRRQNLVRMKTVGTFDLCMEVTAAACGFNQNQQQQQQQQPPQRDTAILTQRNSEEQSVIQQRDDNEYDNGSSSNSNINKNNNINNDDDDDDDDDKTNDNRASRKNSNNSPISENVVAAAAAMATVESGHDDDEGSGKEKFQTTSISPKRHISSSENSFTVDDNLIISSNIKKKFRSLSSARNSEYRCKSAELLDSAATVEPFDEILTCAASASDFRSKKSEETLYDSSSVIEINEDDGGGGGGKTSDEEYKSNIPLSMRRRTLKKSKKIVRTDSELFKDKKLLKDLESSPARAAAAAVAAKAGSAEGSRAEEVSSKNISTDTVFSSEDMCDDDDDRGEQQQQIDLERLESEYKEHVRSSLQREYKSDGDSLDEIGKRAKGAEWRNQSIDFEFLEDSASTKFEAIVHHQPHRSSVYTRQKAESVECKAASRKNSSKRTRSEGDKDTIYVDKNDSIETQSTTEEETKVESEVPKEVKKLSLFERRFSKLCTMNKLLKVKRFSTSALYDNNKRKSAAAADPPKSSSKSTDQPAPPQATPLSLYSQVSDFTSSKVSLASPKSLKGKKFMMKKRKFSFFGKSQSNNDINLNLKSIASKLSLLSKSNFDLSVRNASNPRLNAMGIYNKYGTNNEYRSDILTVKQHGCTSPLSEAFYNATGSYQLTAMELFEKFCSQDFTGLYHTEPLNENEEEEEGEEGEDAQSAAYKSGAIKKSQSLRKATLLKQNSEPKFNIKSYSSEYHHQSFYPNHPAFEEEELDTMENEEEEEAEEEEEEEEDEEEDEYEYEHSAARRRSSYSRQPQVEFDQNDQYFEDHEGPFYLPEKDEDEAALYQNVEGDIDEIYFVPERGTRFDEILAIDETDEDLLEEAQREITAVIEQQEEEREGEAHKSRLLSLYEICPKDKEEAGEGEPDSNDGSDNLRQIITEYVKNTCGSAPGASGFVRSQSMDLLSNASDTLKSNSNSEYAFDTVKQINLDSCSTSKLSLSLNSDIFDDITLAAAIPPDTTIKTLKISEIDDFTITPDGSITTDSVEGKIVGVMSEQEKIKNELQSQYTIIDCDELEHDDGDDVQRFNDEKSSFAEALNKEFDKLFSRVKTDSDTDLTTTPSVNTVLTAIKLPSRCSMEKLEPFDIDAEVIGSVPEPHQPPPSVKALSQSMTSATLHQSIALRKDEFVEKNKSKRSHSLGAISKKKSNKCTPL